MINPMVDATLGSHDQTANPMPNKQAYVWVLHGSNDAGYQAKITRLQQQLAQRLDAKVPWAIAWLECNERSLAGQIQQLATDWAAQGVQQLEIVPLFLLPGVHVMEDIPMQVAQAQAGLWQSVALQVQPYLGSQAVWQDQLHRRWQGEAVSGTRLLVAHGTRRPGGNQMIETLAETLSCQAAYWFVPPSLADQVEVIYAAGQRHITVLPYVLVSGALTEGIDRRIAALRTRLPDLHIDRLPALDNCLVDVMVALVESAS